MNRGTLAPALLVPMFTLLAACAASRSAAPSPPRDLAMTCWRLEGRMLDDDPFWRAPVRLDTAVARPAHPSGPYRGLVSLASEIPADTLSVISRWRVTAPDSLELSRVHAFGSSHVHVRVRGDKMRGSSRHYLHVMSVPEPMPVVRATGRRVPCTASENELGTRPASDAQTAVLDAAWLALVHEG